MTDLEMKCREIVRHAGSLPEEQQMDYLKKEYAYIKPLIDGDNPSHIAVLTLPALIEYMEAREAA